MTKVKWRFICPLTKDFDQNTWYKTGNLSGVVNLEIFEDLQQKIEQKK